MVLTVADLRAVEGGHEYVLSRASEPAEHAALIRRMREDRAFDDTIFAGGDTIHVKGLTEENCASFERALCAALIQAIKARWPAEKSGISSAALKTPKRREP